MQIAVDLDPEAVNQQVSEAIIKSALGARLNQEIDKALNAILNQGFYSQNVIKDVVEQEIAVVVRGLVSQPEVRERVKAIVSAYLAERLTDEVLSNALDKLWNKLMD
jgi:hypothetical protein